MPPRTTEPCPTREGGHARRARLLVVRHGESVWNAEGRWQGQADIPLTDLGRRQAASAARALGSVDLIAASDLVRARETAEIIAAALGAGPVVVEAGLRERDAGAWSGLTRAEIHARYPGYLSDDPVTGSAYGGPRFPADWEPDEQLVARALSALDRLADTMDAGTGFVVSHGGVVGALQQHMTGERYRRLPNLAGAWFERSPSGWVVGERVQLLDGLDVAVTVPSEI
ncbi:MAG: histidine phosphatase family protein [Actinobacteria bacterium]|nr:histidine phosphatase family protein [Actinomycetota bacterium]